MSLPVNDPAFLAFFRNTPLEIQSKVIQEAAPVIEAPVAVAEESYLKETELIINDVAPETAPAVERPRRNRRNL